VIPTPGALFNPLPSFPLPCTPCREKCPSQESPLLRNQLSREAIGYNSTGFLFIPPLPSPLLPCVPRRVKCPSLDSPLLRNQLSREAIGYNITAPLHWRPVKNRYLVMHCSAGRVSSPPHHATLHPFARPELGAPLLVQYIVLRSSWCAHSVPQVPLGTPWACLPLSCGEGRALLPCCGGFPAEQASNRMICIQNHVFLAFLLNRSLLLAPGLRDPSRHRYNWSLILSTPRLQACYGRAVESHRLWSTSLVPVGTLYWAPHPRAAPASRGECWGLTGGGPGKGEEGEEAGGGGFWEGRAAEGGGCPVLEEPDGGGEVPVLCALEAAEGRLHPPLTSRNVEGMDLEALLRLHREELQGVPAILVLDLFYAGELLYRAKDPAFVDLPIVTTKACAGGPVLLPTVT